MIRERLQRVKDMVLGTCKHPRAERGYRTEAIEVDGESTETKILVCLTCEEELPEPTKFFRSYIKLRKHIRLRKGTPTDRDGNKLSNESTYNVGLRFVVPGNQHVVRRVWITFDNKKDQRSFAEQIERRMRFCSDDEAYNEVINEALDIIREANPDIEEQVIERGDSDDDES